MKNCKMAFTIGLVFAIMMLVAACTDSNKSDNHIFDHESLDVDEYVYPSDFDLGDDLKGTNSESDAGFEELSAMIGTYHYTSDYGTGRLMIELQDSIKKYGVLNPLIVRPKIEGYYEIISGHRRKYAAEKLGYKKIPVIIRMLQDDEAVVIMVDSNLQREQITPSEKAYAYKMKYDAIKKRQAERIVVKLTTIQERGVLT